MSLRRIVQGVLRSSSLLLVFSLLGVLPAADSKIPSGLSGMGLLPGGVKYPETAYAVYYGGQIPSSELGRYGRVLEDYGSLAMMELGDEGRSRLMGQGIAVVDLERHRLEGSGWVMDTRQGDGDVPPAWQGTWGQTGLYIVQFYGPIREAWLQEVRALGGRFVAGAYFRNYGYLVWMTGETAQKVWALPYVNWVGVYHPWYKGPHEASDKGGSVPVVLGKGTYSAWRVVTVPWAMGASAAAARLRGLGLQVLGEHEPLHYGVDAAVVVVAGSGREVAPVLRWPEVWRVEPVVPMKPLLRVARELHQTGVGNGCSGTLSEVPVWAAGIRGAGPSPSCTATKGTEQLIGIIDTTYNNPDLECGSGIPNCTIMKYADYRTGQTPSCSMSALQSSCLSGHSHGSGTSGIMVSSGLQDGGETPIEACRRKGHAFGARLWAVKCDQGSGDLNCLNNCHGGAYEQTLTNFFTVTYADGSRLSNHSWGSTLTSYDIGAATVDTWAYDNDNNPGNGLQQKYLWFFAAGNSGPGTGTVGRPAVAKNDVSGAAVYNGVNGSCWPGDSPPCNETKIVIYSSRGPTPDGRHGPDLAGASQNVSSLCDGPGYCPINGTSAGTPNLTALGALIRDWLIQRYGMTDPNAALVKALLLNSGDYVTSPVENLPGTAQGWGRPNLMRLCDDWSNPNCNQVRSKWYEGQFTATGQWVTLSLPVQSGAQPLRCMLVWLDPPNLAGGGALINDLNLKITAPDGTCYRGNQFSGEYSTAGCATFDAVNPDEGVRVQSPAVGTWVLQVQAANIGQSPQPFAVVCSGAIGDLQLIPFASWTGQVIQDSCPSGGPGNGNGVIEPGEVVVLPVTLTNTGSVNLTNVSGVLSTSTPGVTITDDAATWPDLAVGASAQSNPDHFRFTVGSAVTCGTPIALNLAVTYAQGSNNTGATLGVGTTSSTLLLNETFSGGIPATWTVVDGGNCSGPAQTWTTTNPGGRTIGPPFAAPFAIADSDCAGMGCGVMDEQLITPSLDASSCAQVVLEFSNQYRALGDVADVDVSVDGGATWTTVLHMTASDGHPTPNTKTVDITAQAAGHSNVKIRFHYYNANWAWWWAIDNVKVTCYVPVCHVCTPPGALSAANLSIQDPNGNGVWDSGETVTVVPAWTNPGRRP